MGFYLPGDWLCGLGLPLLAVQFVPEKYLRWQIHQQVNGQSNG
jgi:hypothetical protein